jgi:hypothetical protein
MPWFSQQEPSCGVASFIKWTDELQPEQIERLQKLLNV